MSIESIMYSIIPFLKLGVLHRYSFIFSLFELFLAFASLSGSVFPSGSLGGPLMPYAGAEESLMRPISTLMIFFMGIFGSDLIASDSELRRVETEIGNSAMFLLFIAPASLLNV